MALINEIYSSFKNKTRANIKWKMVGDMHTRMDFLQEKFKGIQTITELGPYQGCSTALWISLQPINVTTIDIGKYLDIETFKKAAEEINVNFTFVLKSSLEVEITPCELLFIDTVHTEDHVFKELTLHANKVSKYLAFHDINEKRFSTFAGIKKWWDYHPEWKLDYKDTNDCGFLILKKDLT